jgi:hypothetical protein
MLGRDNAGMNMTTTNVKFGLLRAGMDDLNRRIDASDVPEARATLRLAKTELITEAARQVTDDTFTHKTAEEFQRLI